MISLSRAANQEEKRYPEYVGLSTDGFPSLDDPAMCNGAEIYFMDMQILYKYDAENDGWNEVPLGDGGGGGGGEGTTNYLALSNKPKINGTELVGNKSLTQLGIKYDNFTDRPQINGVTLSGNKTTTELGIDYGDFVDKPQINGNVLVGNKTAKMLGIDYTSFDDKPQVNGVTLDGNKTSVELGITYPNLSQKPSINNVTLEGNKTLNDLGIKYEAFTDKPQVNGVTLSGDKSNDELGITYDNLSDKPKIDGIVVASGDQTADSLDLRRASESYTKDEVDELVAAGRAVKVVNTMPINPEKNTLYYVGVAPAYDVYLVDKDGNISSLGNSDVNFADYQRKNDTRLQTDSKSVVGAINENKLNIDDRLKIADVVNNLETAAARKALSAAMGKILQETKFEEAGTGLTKNGVRINHTNSITPSSGVVGGATSIPQIQYDSTGHLTSVGSVNVYPPTTAGEAGQVWTSRGNGVGQWMPVEAATDYRDLSNKPKINGVTLNGDKSIAELNVQYTDIIEKPKINSVVLEGNKTTAQLGIKYPDIAEKPKINNVEVGQTNSGKDLGVVDLKYTEEDKKGKFILVDDTGEVQYTSPKLNDNDISWYDNTSHELGIIWDGTKEEYDLITNKNPETLYFVDKKKVYLNEEVVADLSDGGIIDVDELPTSNISFGVIYRIIKDVYQFLNRYDLAPEKASSGFSVNEDGVTDNIGILHSWTDVAENWNETKDWFVENSAGFVWRFIYDEKETLQYTTTEPSHPWKITLNMRCKNDEEGAYWQEFYNNLAPVGGGGGTGSYNDLTNKPLLNGVVITGNKTSSDYGIAINLTEAEYLAISDPNPETMYCIVDGADPVKDFDYMNLTNRPSIEGIILRPNMTFDTLGLMTKSQIEAKMTSISKFKGSVAAKSNLPVNPEIGDVWYVTAENANFAWNGSSWANVGGNIDMTAYQTKQSSIPLETASQTIESAINELATNMQPKNVDGKSVMGRIESLEATMGASTLITTAQTVTEAINEIKESAENTANKTDIINETSTNAQYPSAKAVYNARTKLAVKPIYGSNDVNGFKFKSGEICVIDSGDANYLYASVKAIYTTTTNIAIGFNQPIPVLYYDSAKTSAITAKADYPCSTYVDSSTFGVFECLYSQAGLPNAKWKSGAALANETTIHIEFSGLVNRANYDAIYNS